MGALTTCLVLALALLGAEGGCCCWRGGETTRCSVAGASGALVAVECRDYSTMGPNLDTDDTDTMNGTLSFQILRNNTGNVSDDNETSSEHYSLATQYPARLPEDPNGRTISDQTDCNGTLSTPTDCLTVNDSIKVSNFSTMSVKLLSDVSILNMSCFPTVRTVILNASGFDLVNIIGAENVTCLSATFSNLRDASFVKYFTGLTHLNLSHNFLPKVSVSDLPPSILFVDVSYNNISFDTNFILPHRLLELNVSYNNLTMEGVTVKGNVIVFDLRGNRLTRVPELDINSIEELNLSRNNISVLEEKVFSNFTSLCSLDLSSNALTSLSENSFHGLSKLQSLDLSYNRIASIAPATFQFLNSLVNLSLSGNTNLGHLQNVEDASFLFGTGQRLQTIHASGINLTRVPPTVTRSVKNLFLANNAIDNIQCGELDSFPLLQTMYISNNNISEIEEDALGRLDFLTHLLLYGNKLKSVPKSLPDALQVLDLRFNFIEKLGNYDFLGQQSLRVLLLSKNKITSIEDGAFGQLSSLEVLDLSYNPIKSLSRTSFIGPRRLKEMYLVSLTELVPLQEPLSFPAPESSHLEVLAVEASPVLATQLMDDVAALAMFHELFELNLNHCRLSTLRSDLPQYLPRLHRLRLAGNSLNCTNIIWLVKWLQTINISLQDSGKFRLEIYNLNDICGETEEVRDESVMCASPAYLSGKQIISLKEEDFPDLKLTSSTLPPARQVFITEPYRPTSADNTSSSVSSDLIDPVGTSPSDISPQPTYGESFDPTTPKYQTETLQTTVQTKSEVLRNTSRRNSFGLENPQVNPSKLTKTAKSINRISQKWKYLKSETKYKISSLDPVVILLNETKLRDFDNQLNESISDAYLAHEPPSMSHPGMVLFFLVVGVILIAASAMVYSQSRRGPAYHHHQDIEVSSFGGNDLW